MGVYTVEQVCSEPAVDHEVPWQSTVEGSTMPQIDEGYSSLSSTSIDSYSSKYSNLSSARSGFQSSVHDQFRSSAQAYDKSLLQMLDPSREFSLSTFSSSIGSPTSRIAYEHRHPPQLKALSLPIRTGNPDLGEGPLARWTETPRAMSLGTSSRGLDYKTSGRRVMAQTMTDLEPALGGPISAGQKRRASSPLGGDGPALRQSRPLESASRISPTPRYQSPGSMSSTSSGFRSHSYTSTPSLAGSSLPSMNSHGRPSLLGGLSPVPRDCSESPYVTSLSLNPSPRGSISQTSYGRALFHSRPPMTTHKVSDSNMNSKQGCRLMWDVFICECCPKKPKIFDTQEDLNTHEQEKQHKCDYCLERFKKKRDAERHQIALHLRHHSWSCAALSSYAAAFHTSPSRPNEADSCGYCGEEFLRTGISPPTASGHHVVIATEQDWEIRIVHLQEMHKHRQCNHAKKFFRADQFFQHLQHCHAGAKGKWTNMLANACMKDEPPPEPERVSPGNARVARINEEEELL